MTEIMERRFRWNLRQVVAAVDETRRATEGPSVREAERTFIEQRLEALRQFASGVDAAIDAFAQGEAIAPDVMLGKPARKGKKRA